jgi:hypothetical protein
MLWVVAVSSACPAPGGFAHLRPCPPSSRIISDGSGAIVRAEVATLNAALTQATGQEAEYSADDVMEFFGDVSSGCRRRRRRRRRLRCAVPIVRCMASNPCLLFSLRTSDGLRCNPHDGGATLRAQDDEDGELTLTEFLSAAAGEDGLFGEEDLPKLEAIVAQFAKLPSQQGMVAAAATLADDPSKLTAAQLHEAFVAADTDGSGQLERAEVGVLLGGLGVGWSDDDVLELLDELDEDGDGAFSQEELVGSLMELLPIWLAGKASGAGQATAEEVDQEMPTPPPRPAQAAAELQTTHAGDGEQAAASMDTTAEGGAEAAISEEMVDEAVAVDEEVEGDEQEAMSNPLADPSAAVEPAAEEQEQGEEEEEEEEEQGGAQEAAAIVASKKARQEEAAAASAQKRKKKKVRSSRRAMLGTKQALPRPQLTMLGTQI